MTDLRNIYRAVILGVVGVILLIGCNARSTASPTQEPTPVPVSTNTPSRTPPPTPTPTSVPSPTPSPTQAPNPLPTSQAALATATPSPPAPTATLSPTPTPQPTPTPVIIFRAPDIAEVVEKVRPSVVSVVAEVPSRDLFGRLFLDTQSGSGVIFDPQGQILTNNHVIQGADNVTVTLDDGRQFPAEVLGTDQLTDLAVLKIGGETFPAVPLADASKVRVGDWVIAISNALALPGGPTVTVGVISALDREFRVASNLQLYGLIQTDASINLGNSGGPLLNLDGEVVGINTAVARGDLEGRGVEGIGFAVGTDTASPVSQQLIDIGRVQWPWLGVILNELNPELAMQVGVPIREGVLIADILTDWSAWQAGARGGDVIVSMGGKAVSTVRDLIRILRFDHRVGETVELKVFREYRDLTLEVTLEERPSQ